MSNNNNNRSEPCNHFLMSFIFISPYWLLSRKAPGKNTENTGVRLTFNTILLNCMTLYPW